MAHLERKLAQSEATTGATTSDNASNGTTHPVSSLLAPQNQEAPQTGAPPGMESNAVGELVGFLALSSSEAPAYVGASSGLSLAVNLGEMVQTTVWNQVLSPQQNQRRQQLSNGGVGPDTGHGTRGIPPQPPNDSNRFRDRPLRMENLHPASVEPPNDDIGARLVDVYLTRLHVRYPFLDRVELWRLHGERWRLAKAKREELSKSERFGIFKLFLVYAIGATLIQLSENNTLAPPEVRLLNFLSDDTDCL